MLDICLEVASINYRKCVELLLPQLIEHCAGKREPNELDRYLASLGTEAVAAACSLLEEMNADEKDELIVWLVAAHEERLKNAANRELAGVLGGDIVRIGRFAAVDRPGDKLTLLATQVAVDYPRLLGSRAVNEGVEQIGAENSVLKGAAKLALSLGQYLSAESLEKQSVMLLNSAKVRQRLMAVLQEAVCNEGVDVVVESMSVERSTAASPAAEGAGISGLDAYGEKLFAALSERIAKQKGNGGGAQ
ncbi:MAG: hypothetical protein IJU66_03055 [Oscillospiraceae bacterium]|nr:hypothetical protein [Oscillospiraceae bacterium]